MQDKKQAFPSTVTIRLFENFCPVVWILWTWMWILYKACGVYLIGWLQSLKWSTIFLGRLVGLCNKKIRLALWMELEDEEFETSWRKEGRELHGLMAAGVMVCEFCHSFSLYLHLSYRLFWIAQRIVRNLDDPVNPKIWQLNVIHGWW